MSGDDDKQKINSLRSLLYRVLRVLRVLRGQTVCHHEKHEGHKVWITGRAKNARLTKIILRPLRLCGEMSESLSVRIGVNLRLIICYAVRFVCGGAC